VKAGAGTLRGATMRNGAERPLVLPRVRAPVVFGLMVLLFAGLAGRSLYLQWIDNEFLQEQGSARHSRALQVRRTGDESSTVSAKRLRCRHR
jgi:cell division protein FtsI/penicillin-binding protein 2